MLTKTKETMVKPKITPAQVILFGLLVGWLVITNLNQFKDLNFAVQIAAQIAFYVSIMLTAGQKGNVVSLVRSLIGIISNGNNNDVNMMKLQNIVVAACQELGLRYEQEREKFFKHIDLSIESRKKELQAEIDELKKQ